MHPVLVHFALGGRVVEIHAFGVMVALGFLVGTVVAVRRAEPAGLDAAMVRDLALWGLAMSLLGARLVDVVAGGRTALDDCLDGAALGALGALEACTRPLRPWEGGLVFYGGVAGGIATIAWFARRFDVPFGKLLDVLTPSLPLGHAVGRLGCFWAGCCWGRPADLPWAISFPESSAAFRELAAAGGILDGATRTPPLHPTQLYEALGELVLFGLVVLLSRHRARFAALRPDGALALSWVAGYSTFRFFIEMLRGDPSRGYLAALHTPALARALGLPEDTAVLLSTSQGIALLALGVSVALLVIGRKIGPSISRLSEDRAAPVRS